MLNACLQRDIMYYVCTLYTNHDTLSQLVTPFCSSILKLAAHKCDIAGVNLCENSNTVSIHTWGIRCSASRTSVALLNFM